MNTRVFKILISIIGILIILALILLAGLYFFQEKFIFYPEKLEKNYEFNFDRNFEELKIETADGKLLDALLFKADSTKGVIFYLHGNAGSLASWGHVAQCYTDLNYDVFILDYRGFGKSEGRIKSEEQLFADNQIAYNKVKNLYNEQDIIILGYSIGTGLAAKLASKNNPKQLILQAPYFSFEDLLKNEYHFPTFILKYKLTTNEFLKQCQCPIYVFHGDKDRVIHYNSSKKLKNELANKIQLRILKGQAHNGITENDDYQKEIEKILSK